MGGYGLLLLAVVDNKEQISFDVARSVDRFSPGLSYVQDLGVVI